MNEMQMTQDFEYELSNFHIKDSCSYCDLSEEECLVKCLDCSKFFCNQATNQGSHIITHLVRARHNKTQLHPASALGETILECYNCQLRNVFLLGFIPAKQDTVIVILCRNCTTKQNINWNTRDWLPLIQDRSFLPWLVKLPAVPKTASKQEIMKKEQEWNCQKIEEEEEVENGKLTYEDGFEYQNIFGPLVKIEADYNRIIKEQQTQEDIVVRWDGSRAFFNLKLLDSSDVKLNLGDDLRLSYNGELRSHWQQNGVVIKIPDSKSAEVGIEVKNPPTEVTHNFTIDFVWKSTSFDRMQQALKTFAVDKSAISQYIYNKILGKTVEPTPLKAVLPRRVSAPGLPDLNHSQVQAVKSVLQKHFSLIQGPPGTGILYFTAGKTVTSATIVYHFTQQKQGQVLVCAPSNVAVDNLCMKIHMTGLKVIRLCAKSREVLETGIGFLSLHEQVDQYPDQAFKVLVDRKKREILSQQDEHKYKQMKKDIERTLLQNADVICCTCSGAGDKRLARMKFKYVLIDEATQASEPESLIPLVLGCKQAVLVGDHRQLGPVIVNKRAVKAGLHLSLFERMITLGMRADMLQVQYRMHPCLSEFPSNFFYEGSLQNGVTAIERENGIDFPWPNSNTPIMFHSSYGVEELTGSGTTYLNVAEAGFVERVVTKLLKGGILPHQIGIITPYEGQRAYIVQQLVFNGSLSKSLYENVEVASVDAFQGREKDYIIVSCVRSNDNVGIGFLSNAKRLNVALTRARYGLILVGNPRVLGKELLWWELIEAIRVRKCLVEGPLHSLKVSMIRIEKPKRKEHRETVQAESKDEKLDDFMLGEFGFSQFSLPGIPLTQSSQSQSMTQDLFSQDRPAAHGGIFRTFGDDFLSQELFSQFERSQLDDYKSQIDFDFDGSGDSSSFTQF